MSIFARGNWAVFGIEPESLSTFQKGLEGDLCRFKASQLSAGVAIKLHGVATVGINPYGSPRLDDEARKDESIDKLVMDILKAIEKDETAGLEFEALDEYLPTEVDLSIGNNAFAFWLAVNDPKDVSDPASKKEAIAYTDMERPFRFLAKKEKEIVEEQVNASAVMSRKQFPVILDFQHGRCYAETTSKDDILALRELLTNLGVTTFSLCWGFGEATWPSKFLNKVNEDTRFASEMKSRADELSRLRPEEIDKLEDKELEKIVAAYFAFTPMGNGFVSALGCPSQVRIHKVSDPVVSTSPSVSFSLLNMTNDAELAGASLTLVEPYARKVKGVEKTAHRSLLSIDIHDAVSNFDAGVAFLRGLDLPQFKKHVKTALKAQGHMAIKDFWSLWLNELHDAVLTVADSITNVLDLKDGNYGLTVIGTGADSTEIEVKE